eukprot:CAMPEP_0197189094 /NCGR_PEP_ID=MMETSP1423-20130617/19155_1 /TAXON_ID=476441 /ORGANISM="Pseudo-nitzschia heimii, Strain UNC1101" /LENGTH=460 /DNA_ID=CAMNT_0042641127 /DNA_START=171 /DNA_END=1553 /DNA_ORIENTATION=+
MGNCELRKYPKTRYYGLDERPLPSFLDTEYIYGELPQMLELQKEASGSQASKLCVDQSEWYQPKKETGTSTPPLPFADGTNPSILKIDNPRIDSSIRKLLYDNVVGRRKESPYYLATICMTDSQCSWNDSPEEIAEFHLSTDKKPSTVRTILLVLNQNFETMMEATIYTKIDAPFNGRFKPNNQTKTFQLDDARLFTHNGQVWVSYREGKIFGYDKQVLNKIHFDFIDSTTVGEITDVEAKSLRTSHNHNNIKNKQLTATLLSSETETLCCGRNMALIDNVHTDELQALTWADPVTVVSVDTSKTDAVSSSATQRRLKKKGKKKKESHFHGTNGFMVHLPTTGEYLGIGHFHRPSGRDQNPHARFGHHYTHAFFTITDQPPFRLKRLSAELVLPSYSYPEDTEIIQFWSGLELDGTTLALAYGINDCEGAATRLDLAVIEGLLRDVPEGKEVVDLMMPQK